MNSRIDTLEYQLETSIVRRVVSEILGNNVRISVNDGGGWAIKYSKDADAVMASLRSTDSDKLYLHREGHDMPFGWVYLVWGNSPWEAIADYTENCAPYMKRTIEAIDKCEDSGNWASFLQ